MATRNSDPADGPNREWARNVAFHPGYLPRPPALSTPVVPPYNHPRHRTKVFTTPASQPMPSPTLVKPSRSKASTIVGILLLLGIMAGCGQLVLDNFQQKISGATIQPPIQLSPQGHRMSLSSADQLVLGAYPTALLPIEASPTPLTEKYIKYEVVGGDSIGIIAFDLANRLGRPELVGQIQAAMIDKVGSTLIYPKNKFTISLVSGQIVVEYSDIR